MVIKIESLSSTHTIQYPSDGHHSEFEVQAYLYRALQDRGFDVRGELKARLSTSRQGSTSRQACRFDLVVFKDGEPTCIIEVKRRQRKHKAGLEKTRQAHRYRQFGVPCYFVYGMDAAKNLLEEFHP